MIVTLLLLTRAYALNFSTNAIKRVTSHARYVDNPTRVAYFETPPTSSVEPPLGNDVTEMKAPRCGLHASFHSRVSVDAQILTHTY